VKLLLPSGEEMHFALPEKHVLLESYSDVLATPFGHRFRYVKLQRVAGVFKQFVIARSVYSLLVVP
jgi:hypothetical protein